MAYFCEDSISWSIQEDKLYSELLSGELPGDLLQSGQKISSFSIHVKSPQLGGPTSSQIQPGPQAYWETWINSGTKEGHSIHSPRPTNTRAIQIAKGKNKTISNRSQNTWALSEPSSPTIASPEYNSIHKNQVPVLKYYLMKKIESFTEHVNNSLKEIQ